MKESQLPQLGATGPGGRIRRANLSIQRCADTLFGVRGATTDQFALLRTVKRWEGIRQNQLATEMFTDASTIAAMLRLLETRGLIRREVCAEDGRARRVYLNPAGARLLGQLEKDWAPYRQIVGEHFQGPAGDEALRILESIAARMVEIRLEILKDQPAKLPVDPGAKRR
jgi:DNA-binding MarR family transcriptional regulator